MGLMPQKDLFICLVFICLTINSLRIKIIKQAIG